MDSSTNASANSEDATNTFRERVLTFVASRSTGYSSLTGSMRSLDSPRYRRFNAPARIFSDRKTGAKITIGFGCVPAITAVISFISYSEFGRLQFDFTDYARKLTNGAMAIDIDREFVALRRHIGEVSNNMEENFAAPDQSRTSPSSLHASENWRTRIRFVHSRILDRTTAAETSPRNFVSNLCMAKIFATAAARCAAIFHERARTPGMMTSRVLNRRVRSLELRGVVQNILNGKFRFFFQILPT